MKRNVIALFSIHGVTARKVKRLKEINGESLANILRTSLKYFFIRGNPENYLRKKDRKETLIIAQIRLPDYLERLITELEYKTGESRVQIAKCALEWAIGEENIEGLDIFLGKAEWVNGGVKAEARQKAEVVIE